MSLHLFGVRLLPLILFYKPFLLRGFAEQAACSRVGRGCAGRGGRPGQREIAFRVAELGLRCPLAAALGGVQSRK